MKISAQKVSVDNFREYGKVVEGTAGKPTSQDETYKFWSDIANYEIDGRTEIGLCTVYRQEIQQVTGIERHLHTPEILIPVDAPFVLPVLKSENPEDGIDAFRVDIGQAVVIDPGGWHGPCIPDRTEEATYFVIFRHNTPYEDVESTEIEPVRIE
ncbi:MAG: ureidoglycolate lyase [Candidatus Marinimicrobia bacterium]|nr:ureidoglycolate lyase [Candidatus Neomarinimicrobiota bacterium]